MGMRVLRRCSFQSRLSLVVALPYLFAMRLAVPALHVLAALAVAVFMMPLVPSPVSTIVAQTGTFATRPTAVGRDVRIFVVEGVSSLTMSLASIDGGWSKPTQCVFATGCRFEVGGIHATPYTTKVVQGVFLWDAPDQRLISESVGHRLDPVFLTTSNIILPVTRRLQDRAVPFPTSGFFIDRELRSKPFWQFVEVHSDLLSFGEQTHGHFDHGRFRDTQRISQCSNHSHALWTQAVTCGEFVSHGGSIPRYAGRRKR